MGQQPGISSLIEQGGAFGWSAHSRMTKLIEARCRFAVSLQLDQRHGCTMLSPSAAAQILPGNRRVQRLLCIGFGQIKAAIVAGCTAERTIVQRRRRRCRCSPAGDCETQTEKRNRETHGDPIQRFQRRGKSAIVASARIPITAFVTAPDNPTILQVIPRLDAGGAERTTIDMARALAREGFQALVATEGGRLEQELRAAGARVLQMPLDSKAPHAMLANAARLVRIIRRDGVRIVHARSRAPAWSALAAARSIGIPFVTTYHGIYNAGNPFKRFYNSVMAKGAVVIANSQWTADHIAREHGTPRDRIVIIHRGVDLQHFDPAGVSPNRVEAMRNAWGVTSDQLTVLLPGRLTRWKGQLVLIDALAQLARQDALTNAKAVLAGDAQGRSAYVTELRKAIEMNGLSNFVNIADHITDMPAAYLASDLVVSASTDPEAFGRVAAEAGAMARPVIATDHGGARETVLDNVSGVLTPPGDADALARALKTVLESGAEQRRDMGGCGRAHVRANFSLEQMCARTLAIYRDLLSGRRPG